MKRIFFGIAAASLIIASIPTVWASQSAIDKKNAEIQRIEQQLRSIESRKTQTSQEKTAKEREAASLRSQIATLNTEISELQGQLDSVASEITVKETSISQAEGGITELEQKLNDRKSAMGFLIKDLYITSTMKNEVITAINANNISEVFAQVEYSNEVQTQIEKAVNDIIAHKTWLEEEKQRLSTERANLASVQTDLEQKKSVIESQRSQTATQANASQVAANQLDASLDSLSAQASQLQQKRQSAMVELSRLESALQSQYGGGGTVCTGRGYAWPVQGGRITQGYGWTSFAMSGAYSGYMHNGIDIASSTGTPIYATASGTVVSVGFNNLSYGKWIVIQHDDGYYSLYGHLSAQSVGYGQRVDRGQYIGAMGSTGYSTGPHLHFTIYLPGSLRIGSSPQGASVNPSTCGY